MAERVLITVDAAAQMMGLSRRAVYSLVQSNKLPRYSPSLGKSAVRLDKADVEAHINASCARPVGQLPRKKPLQRVPLLALAKYGYRYPA